MFEKRGRTIRWKVLKGCWPAPAMVVEGMNVKDICILSFVLSLFIFWTFRILAHEEDPYSHVYKTLSKFFVYSTKTA